MGTRPPRLTHVRVLVENYAACFEFYRDVLGYEATFGDAESGYADFDTGATTLALFDRGEMLDAVGDADPGDGPAEGSDRVALVLGAEDLDRTHERLRDRGVEFVTPPTDRPEWGIRTAHCRDPDGTLIELNEPLD